MSETLYAELTKEQWAMEPRSLEGFLEKVRGLPEFPPMAEASDSVAVFLKESPALSRLTVAGDVGEIRISGVLMKRVPNIFRWFGVDATGYGDIQRDLAAAVSNPDVKTIRLVIESPGGQVAGIKGAADAIYAARKSKTVTATIEDIGASAAYWLASQAETIDASDPNSSIGSIGVYVAVADMSKMAENDGVKVHVISSGPLKGAGVPGTVITDEQLSSIQEIIDGLASNFIHDVARGRGRSTGDVRDWATGQVWLARNAQKMGLIDSLRKSKSQTTSRSGSSAADLVPKGEKQMGNEHEAAEHENAKAQAVEEARSAERKRLMDLKAAFPNDLAFATAQWEAGATVDQAKAAYSDILSERLAEMKKENEDLKKRPAGVRGASPVPVGGTSSDESSNGGFMEKSKALSKAEGITMREAMSRVSKSEPSVYQSYLDECAAAAPAHHARKKELGLR